MKYTQAEKAAIGQRLKAAREAAELTLEKVGARFEVGKATVGHWETGHSLVDPLTLLQLCKLYRVGIEQIMLGEAAPPKYPPGGALTISATLAHLAQQLAGQDSETREDIKAAVVRLLDKPESAGRAIESVRRLLQEPEAPTPAPAGAPAQDPDRQPSGQPAPAAREKGRQFQDIASKSPARRHGEKAHKA